MEEKLEKLRSLSEETAGTAYYIKPIAEGYCCYFLQQKVSIEGSTITEALDEAIHYIESNSEKVDEKDLKRTKGKIYRIKK